MKVVLLVNNQQIDLAPNVSVPLNFQGSNSMKSSDLLLSFTNSFSIPLTNNNVDILQNSGYTTSLSKIPYKVISATLLLNGQDIFGLSRLFLMEFSSNSGWTASFIAGQFDKIIGGSLRQLNLSQYNFVWNQLNVSTRANATTYVSTAPVYCGVSNRPTQPEINIMAHKFCFHGVQLLQIIFQALAIPLRFKLTKGTLAARSVIFADRLVKIQSEYLGYTTTANRSGTNQLLTGAATGIIFNSVVSGNESGGYSIATGRLTVPYGSRVKISVELSVNFTLNLTTIRTFTLFARIGANIENVDFKKVEFTPDVAGVYTINLELEAYITGTTTVYVEHTAGATVQDSLLIGSVMRVQVLDDLIFGNTVDIAKSLPDLTSADFFKSYLSMSNAITLLKQDSLVVMNFDRLPESGLKDWSDKFDCAIIGF